MYASSTIGKMISFKVLIIFTHNARCFGGTKSAEEHNGQADIHQPLFLTVKKRKFENCLADLFMMKFVKGEEDKKINVREKKIKEFHVLVRFAATPTACVTYFYSQPGGTKSSSSSPPPSSHLLPTLRRSDEVVVAIWGAGTGAGAGLSSRTGLR